MNIAHISPVYLPYKSGMTYVARTQCEELVRRGHDVTVFTVNTKYQIPNTNEIIEGVKVKRMRSILRYGNAGQLPQLLWSLKKYDVVQLHYPFFGAVEWVLLAKKLGFIKKLVVFYHMDAQLSGIIGLIRKVYEKMFLPRLFKAADKIIVSSKDYAEHSDHSVLFERYSKKLAEVPIGIDSGKFKIQNSKSKIGTLKEKLDIDKDSKVVLFVGGMDKAHWFKGVDVLLRAFANILSRSSQDERILFPPRAKRQGALPETKYAHPVTHFSRKVDSASVGEGGGVGSELTLVLVGDGDMRDEHEALARELGIEERVRFVGRVSDEDLPVYYHMCDVFVLPSVNSAEAFGIVLLEAMACGKPVIASDLAGVRSVALKNGILVKPGDVDDLSEAIEKIFDNRSDFSINSDDLYKYTLKGSVEILESIG